jgi:hypothetical protein
MDLDEPIPSTGYHRLIFVSVSDERNFAISLVVAVQFIYHDS